MEFDVQHMSKYYIFVEGALLLLFFFFSCWFMMVSKLKVHDLASCTPSHFLLSVSHVIPVPSALLSIMTMNTVIEVSIMVLITILIKKKIQSIHNHTDYNNGSK